MSECQNCVAAHRPQFTLRYSLSVVNQDGSEGAVHFKIAKARAMVEADPRPPRRIEPDALQQFLDEHAEAINTAHLDHIPNGALRVPGLVVQFDELDEHGQLRPTSVLIDGTHRAARSLRDGQPFFAYLLTDNEMAAIVEVEGTEHGRVPGCSPDFSATPLGSSVTA
jgi:hypothetical protein